jgi:hypothetical protein
VCPPDLGQGVNAALEDVILLCVALDSVGTDGGGIQDALRRYVAGRDADVSAFMRLLVIGGPYPVGPAPGVDRGVDGQPVAPLRVGVAGAGACSPRGPLLVSTGICGTRRCYPRWMRPRGVSGCCRGCLSPQLSLLLWRSAMFEGLSLMDSRRPCLVFPRAQSGAECRVLCG